jgi:hypothetical protein
MSASIAKPHAPSRSPTERKGALKCALSSVRFEDWLRLRLFCRPRCLRHKQHLRAAFQVQILSSRGDHGSLRRASRRGTQVHPLQAENSPAAGSQLPCGIQSARRSLANCGGIRGRMHRRVQRSASGVAGACGCIRHRARSSAVEVTPPSAPPPAARPEPIADPLALPTAVMSSPANVDKDEVDCADASA